MGVHLISLDPSVCLIRPWQEQSSGPYCLGAERYRWGTLSSQNSLWPHFTLALLSASLF